MIQKLDRTENGDVDRRRTGAGSAPGKATLTSRLYRSVTRGGRTQVDRAGDRDDNGVAAGAEALVDRAASSSGHALPTPLQRQFETSTGSDLSSVRVHTGAESASAAQAVGAKAYTVGQDIHFAAGRYQPDDPFGMHLLAHEVAHTVQQSGGAQRRQNQLEVSTPHDAAEHEADRAADAMVAGRPIDVRVGEAGLHRQPASCSGAPQLRTAIDAAVDLETVRDLKYAIDDATLGADNETRTIVYGEQQYTVGLLEAEELYNQVHARELELMGQTPASHGESLDSRVSAAIAAKNVTEIIGLADAIDNATVHYTSQGVLEGDWLIPYGAEEIRTTRIMAASARKRLEPHLPKSIDKMTPPDVRLKSLNAGFHIAPNRAIADGLETGDKGTGVWMGLTRTALAIRFTPALEASWHGIGVADVQGVTLYFSTGGFDVEATGIAAGKAKEEIRDKVLPMLAGSGFEVAGYDPYADDWLQTRFENLQATVAASAGPAASNQVEAKDITGAYAAAQLLMRTGITQLDDKQTGLVIAPATDLTIAVISGGTAAKGDLLTLGRATVTASGATLQSEGAPVLKLKKVSLERGGKVTLGDFELLGAAKDAANGESLLRLIVGAAELSQGGVPDEAALRIAAAKADPTFVPGLAKHEVEQKIEAAIRAAVDANRDVAVGGKTVGELLGL